mmetsp:Transcript_10164/g.22853  ORF Transcript_10164/g.22853 Transcript_10164/m.22853 type:complete len:118 (+) Transcript_10164:204-557(+)
MFQEPSQFVDTLLALGMLAPTCRLFARTLQSSPSEVTSMGRKLSEFFVVHPHLSIEAASPKPGSPAQQIPKVNSFLERVRRRGPFERTLRPWSTIELPSAMHPWQRRSVHRGFLVHR